jgi:hypothetical protein
MARSADSVNGAAPIHSSRVTAGLWKKLFSSPMIQQSGKAEATFTSGDCIRSTHCASGTWRSPVWFLAERDVFVVERSNTPFRRGRQVSVRGGRDFQ